jgi:hypothetical protein
MLRTLSALAASFFAVAVVWMVLVAILFAVGTAYAPQQFVLPEPGQEAQAPTGLGWLLATLVIDAAAAFVGGLIVVWLAPTDPRGLGLMAAGMMCIGCVLQVVFDTGRLPAWVPLARVVVAPAALLLATRLCLGAEESGSHAPESGGPESGGPAPAAPESDASDKFQT